MTCYFPISVSTGRSNPTVSCGQCRGCRLERSRQWAVRCVHEASLHAQNCFVTLTYDAEHVPKNGSLVYRDFQLFMKRLRKYADVPIRFYMCGEYGELNGRPHFHACLFGFDFSDRLFFKTSESGFKLYISKSLESLWRLGYSTVADVTFESAAYVARYVMKKFTGSGAAAHYVDVITGELRVSEFAHMSLRPGIGMDWFVRYWSDIRAGLLVVNGVEVPAPRYYTRMLEKMDMFEDAKDARFAFSLASARDRSPERLRVRDAVHAARVAKFHRDKL